MNYKIIYFLVIAFFLYSCETTSSKKNIKIKFENKYKNIGFALIYNEKLDDIKKIDQRSLNIYHKTLRKRSLVKITNPKNGKSLLAEVKSNNVKFSNFYNSVLSSRIAETLELDFNEPYIEIIAITKNSTFVAKKSKTFDEERSVAEKAPIDGIQINDLNLKKTKKKKKQEKDFSYSIKVADFYYLKSAKNMKKKIVEETSIKKVSILKISANNYRVFLGPFKDLSLIKKAFDDMNIINFKNLEIIKNEKNI